MKQSSCINKDGGFTLIEVAIIIAIIGILIVPFVYMLNIELQNQKIKTTRGNISIAEAALKKYALRNGAYPRPAAPNSSTQGQASPIPGAGFPACTPTLGFTCQTPGSRDINPANGVNDPVLIGTLPFMDIGLPPEYSIDGYGSKLSYAVTQSLTNNASFNDLAGAINVNNIDRDLNAINNAHFIVFSHGDDQHGAFTLTGNTMISPCITVNITRDSENCDRDSTFDGGFTGNEDPTRPRYGRSRMYAAGGVEDVGFWNDYYTFITTVYSDIWSPIINTSNIRNTNQNGGIRINTNEADDRIRVDVGGDVRAERIYTNAVGNTAAGTVECSGAEGCFRPLDIGRAEANTPVPLTSSSDSDGIRCANDTAMTGISRGNQLCNTLNAPPSSVSAYSCPTSPRQYPYGIDANGKILCRLP